MGIKVKRLAMVLMASLCVSSLSGCMFLSDSQKTAVDVYLNKKTPDDMVKAAQTAMNDANYIQCLVNYRIDKIDQDKSMTDVIVDADTWDFRAIKGADAGYWKGSSTRNNETVKSELAYCVRKEDENAYDIYKTIDGGKSWIRETNNGMFSGVNILSIDYSKLEGCEGLQVDKEPIKRDEVTQWRIFGTLTNSEARGFLAGLEKNLSLTPDPSLPEASTVDFEMFMNTDNQPTTVTLKFNPKSTLETNLIYSNWEVRLSYSNYDAYSSLTIPKEATLGYITQEQQKDKEQSFLIDGAAIQVETTAEEETEFQLDEDDELLEFE